MFEIKQGDSFSVLQSLPTESVDCIVTSPPYWGLRDYGIAGQLGLEPTYQEYIAKLTAIFNEVKRVLKPDGTCFVNIGDTFLSSGGASRHKGYSDPKYKEGRNGSFAEPHSYPQQGIQPKSLCQIPNRFAIAMMDNGWILRNEIIWHKPNAMPQSVKDRFTVDFEKVFFFTKSKKYYFQQQLENAASGCDLGILRSKKQALLNTPSIIKRKNKGIDSTKAGNGFKNKRAVWSINTQPLEEAHFAAFPEKLVEPMILAGCPENGVVLDPFSGAATTGIVSNRLNRHYIGIELNPEYIALSEKRIKQTQSQTDLF